MIHYFCQEFYSALRRPPLQELMDNLIDGLGKLYNERVLSAATGPGTRRKLLRGHRVRRKRRSSEGQQSAYRQRKMQRQPRFRPAQIDARDFIDAIHAIEQGIPMHD